MASPHDELIRLARPVRHEANNLLAALGGTADLMLRAATGERDRVRAERMREASTRLEALLKAYLSLAAPPVGENGTDVAQLLTLLRPLVVLTLGPGRSVEITAAPDLPRIAIPPSEVQVLGLARAAAAAMAPDGGLVLRLERAAGGVSLTAVTVPDNKQLPSVVLAAAPA